MSGLVNPIPGDKVQSSKGKVRTVVYVTLLDQVIYDPPKGAQRICDLRTWRTWAKGGTVLEHGRVEVPVATVGIEETHQMSGQATLIANRIMESANRSRSRHDIAINMTPTDDVKQVLYEAALAAYWKDHAFRQLVDEETTRRAGR